VAIIFNFSGSVPPDATSSTFTLSPGEYTIRESATGASCDWSLCNSENIIVLPGTEGSSSSILITNEMAGDYYLKVTAYQDGGPFNLEISSQDAPPDPEVPPTGEKSFMVYELEKGWSFDGYYIPHFLELNWYFGDTPITYHTIQKLRVYGLAKGNVDLQVSTNGMQTSFLEDYTSAQYIDLRSPYKFVSSDFKPVTEFTDLENRGISIQMKFEGRNTDILKPVPGHVLQVLVVQSSPEGTGFTAN